jgi:hypothetical protein
MGEVEVDKAPLGGEEVQVLVGSSCRVQIYDVE